MREQHAAYLETINPATPAIGVPDHAKFKNKHTFVNPILWFSFNLQKKK
jgi:hypothetical protein